MIEGQRECPLITLQLRGIRDTQKHAIAAVTRCIGDRPTDERRVGSPSVRGAGCSFRINGQESRAQGQ